LVHLSTLLKKEELIPYSADTFGRSSFAWWINHPASFIAFLWAWPSFMYYTLTFFPLPTSVRTQNRITSRFSPHPFGRSSTASDGRLRPPPTGGMEPPGSSRRCSCRSYTAASPGQHRHGPSSSSPVISAEGMSCPVCGGQREGSSHPRRPRPCDLIRALHLDGQASCPLQPRR
jgi:hypothetical protein